MRIIPIFNNDIKWQQFEIIVKFSPLKILISSGFLFLWRDQIQLVSFWFYCPFPNVEFLKNTIIKWWWINLLCSSCNVDDNTRINFVFSLLLKQQYKNAMITFIHSFNVLRYMGSVHSSPFSYVQEHFMLC